MSEQHHSLYPHRAPRERAHIQKDLVLPVHQANRTGHKLEEPTSCGLEGVPVFSPWASQSTSYSLRVTVWANS